MKRQRYEPPIPSTGSVQSFIKRNREESIRSGAPVETLFCGFVPCRFPHCVRIHVDWAKYRICRFFNSHYGCDRLQCRYKHERPTFEQQQKPSVVQIPPPVCRPSLPSSPPLPSPPPPPLPSVLPLPSVQIDDVDTEEEDDADTVPDEDTLKKIEDIEKARVASVLLAASIAKEERIKEEAMIAAQEAKKVAEKQKQKERDNARGIFSHEDLFGPPIRFERN